ncbi:23S rRNA (adenine(2503)-C(2))-methyltransferase RlmN [Poseidonibacter sp.]|uniref:23S rRNA (adenine(2503)-C(2))-methyltransferase RlmN n=1 Tax=Poseidonibacter sp. TaxID=2321188 RepID=UPI003C725C1B
MLKSVREYEYDDFLEAVKALKLPAFRGKQVYEWVNKGFLDFDSMTNIPKQVTEVLKEHFTVSKMKIIQVMASKFDGTKKYLMSLEDGHVIECVYMMYKHGNTLCVSSQVGCRMKCSFCASTVHGLERNLSSGEILGQVLEVMKDTGTKISNVVLMGSGEPLDNYDEVLKFIKRLNHPKGLNISMRNITLSTCGVIPRIKDLMAEKLQITLAVSLHAVDNEARDALMPVNKSYPIKALLDVCKEYIRETGRRVSFEFALIKDQNDTPEVARRLGELLKGMNCHVNLIPINPVDGKNYVGSSQDNVKRFQNILSDFHVEATTRRSLGADIDAACGQLRNKHINVTF